MYSGSFTQLGVFEQLLFLLLLSTELPCVFGILEIKHNGLENNSSNSINPVIKFNSSVITDNSIDVSSGRKPTASQRPTTFYHKDRNELSVSTNIGLHELFISSQETLTKKSSLSTVPVFTNYSTTPPPQHHDKSTAHKYKILLYTLIPLSAILFIIGLMFMVRHIQKVKRKRRLERELIHQYSYPNSEAGDFDDEQRILEVESVINTQFHLANDQEEKNFVAQIPQVSVNIGEGSKLVIEEESPLMDNMETSTSFNC